MADAYWRYTSGGHQQAAPTTLTHLVAKRSRSEYAFTSRNVGMVGGRLEATLPPDASSTLFIEGLPADCTIREVSHIFRPLVGYKEVRHVPKGSRHARANPLILCFVDFTSPLHAAAAMDVLQGYKFDEHELDSVSLRLQFARNPGVRSGGGNRTKR